MQKKNSDFTGITESQLRARIHELEEALADYAHHPHTCPAWGELAPGECDCGCSDVLEVLDRTPAQSLASIKAQTLREFAEEFKQVGGETPSPFRKDLYIRAIQKSDLIEQEAK